MNLRDLKYLITVSELKHFGKAAEACFVSQPTLSMQLKKLEEFLGVTLIERTNKQMMMTPIGEEIVARAREVVAGAEEIRSLAKLQQDPFAGILKLGVIPTIAPYFLPEMLAKCKKAFPELTIHIREAQTATLSEELRSGKIDAAVMAMLPELEMFDNGLLQEEPFMVAVPDGHDFAKKKTLTQADLQGEPLLLLEDGHCLRDQALEACQFASAPSGVNFRGSSLETIREMVRSGAGITIMPERATRKEKGITTIPFASPAPSRDITLLWRKSSSRIDLLDKMVELLGK